MNQATPDTDGTPLDPDPTTLSGDRYDETTGGEDSSPYEGLSSDERAAAAHEPQNQSAG
jgi:hypothetical protein